MKHPAIATVGQLRALGYAPCTVKEELRRNLIRKLRTGEELFPGIVGYRDTVIPQVINGVLSQHDLLFLGLRGQAKTRLIRLLPQLLDEWMPVLSGVEINDDPVKPITRSGRRIVEEQGDDAKIEWVHRDARYQEKLATPDVTIADLIGEIDLVKHAEGRYLSDETTMHYGLIPRSNRGIFAINELPDLAPRIQVGLFNVLEERDVQIRGYPIRLNLDLCLVFSANPEDYTNRGRIVTPLKDRIGSVIRTHYPHSLEEGIQVSHENAWLERAGSADSGVQVHVPQHVSEIVEQMIALARSSPHVSQASGVSVRASICCIEAVVSNAERRAILLGTKEATCRVTDLYHLVAACRGKIELTLAEDEAAEDKLIQSLTGEAIKAVFEQYAELGDYEAITEQFKNKLTFPAGDEISDEEFVENMGAVEGLLPAAKKLARDLRMRPENPGELASAGELLLEGLYVNNRLGKYTRGGKVFFSK
jgi:magnesium chelatase subunit I